MVEEIPMLSAHIEDTIRAIAKLHADHREEAGRLRVDRPSPIYCSFDRSDRTLDRRQRRDTGVRKSALG